MKTFPFRLYLALGFSFLAPGASSGAAAAAPPTIEAELEVMWTAWRAPEPTGADRATRAHWEYTDQKFQTFVKAARALAAKYPADPRRYAPLIQSSYTAPYFIKSFKPEFDAAPGPNNAVIDTEAKIAHLRAQVGFLGEIVAATDADPRQRGGAFNALLVDSRLLAGLTGQTFDPAALAPVVDRVLAALPDERALPVVEQFAGALRRDNTGAAQAFQAKIDALPALAAAKKKMQDYAAAKNMPWPQHYDGQFWKNEFAVKFGIQSIPAMFLLDQEGRIASTAARGEALDREVRRLLKL